MRDVSPRSARTPDPSYRPRRSLVATAVLAGLVVVPLLAVSYPVATAVVASTAVATVAAARVAPAVLGRIDSVGSVPTVCVPGTDVCLGSS